MVVVRICVNFMDVPLYHVLTTRSKTYVAFRTQQKKKSKQLFTMEGRSGKPERLFILRSVVQLEQAGLRLNFGQSQFQLLNPPAIGSRYGKHIGAASDFFSDTGNIAAQFQGQPGQGVGIAAQGVKNIGG